MDIDEFLSTEAQKSEELTGKGPRRAESYTDRTILDQIGKVKELIKQRNFKEAERVYYVVKENYANLAKQQEEERKKMHREITSINKQLIDNLTMLKSEVDKKAQIILQLLEKAKEYMRTGELKKANSLYIEIRQIFKQLPDAFAEKKMALENEILAFYGQLVNDFNKKAYHHLQEKEKEINKHITLAIQYIKQGKVQLAKKEYTFINQLYTELPDGFLYEKTMIYRKILDLFRLAESGAAGIRGEEMGLPAAEITTREMPELGIGSAPRVSMKTTKSVPELKSAARQTSSDIPSPPPKKEETEVPEEKQKAKASVEAEKKKGFFKGMFKKKQEAPASVEKELGEHPIVSAGNEEAKASIEKKISGKKEMAAPPPPPAP